MASTLPEIDRTSPHYRLGYGIAALRGIIRDVDYLTPNGPRGALADLRRAAVDALRVMEGN